jgi:hypothetical protein
MDSIKESKHSMFLATKDYLTSKDILLKKLPKYAELFARLCHLITLIQGLGEEQNLDKKGVALDKRHLREILSLLAIDTSRRIKAHATLEKNLILLNETKYTESDLKRCTDTQIREVAQGIHNRAQSNLPALAEFGVTAEKLQALQDAINTYVVVTPKPRLHIAEGKQSTDKTAELFKEAETILKSIDLLIEMQKIENPDLYKGYRGVRRIVNTSPIGFVIKGKVVDAKTGEPIKGATLEFVLESNGSQPNSARAPQVITKRTADKGGFTDKSFSTGIYSVTVKKNGFIDLTDKAVITEGECLEVVYKLTRI